ncbi:Uncharacterised protein [Mycobacteroides abscessus subsp. abscessus]|nr:Uncharacterised protein [Mycobacteroides abscessus subsp. abscessus]
MVRSTSPARTSTVSHAAAGTSLSRTAAPSGAATAICVSIRNATEIPILGTSSAGAPAGLPTRTLAARSDR